MARKSKPVREAPMPRIKSTPELDAFAAKVKASGGSESTRYNSKSRNNLKRGFC